MPPLLFISPLRPNPAGTGAAQRAFHTLKILGERFRIDLLVTADPGPLPDATAQLVAKAVILPPTRFRDPHYAWAMLRHSLAGAGLLPPSPQPDAWLQVTPRQLRLARRQMGPSTYAVIHAFRLSSAPFAWHCHRDHPGCRLHLDLDEAESGNLLRQADLLERSGEPALAARTLVHGQVWAGLEEEWLPRFQRLLVSSPKEAARLPQAQRPGELRVAPNIVDPPPELPSPLPLPAGPPSLLFVGSFGYYPNRDGVRYFLSEIAPRLRPTTPFRLVCVGYGLEGAFRRWLADQEGVLLPGGVEDIVPWYRQAAAAVVPLRAGGGTRIKILEAFALGCPVVSTTLGAEGLQVTAGRELLLADDPEGFAGHCRRLLGPASRREELTQNAYRLVCERYGDQALREALLD